MMEAIKLYASRDHAGHWPMGCNTVVAAYDEEQARALLDLVLEQRGLPASALHPYTLHEVNVDVPGPVNVATMYR